MNTTAVTSAQMKAMEAAANAKGLSYDEMMRRAGGGCAKKVLDLLYALDPTKHVDVLVLVGPGNNGGDGLVCGTYIMEHIRPNACVIFISWKRNRSRSYDWPRTEALAAQELFDFAGFYCALGVAPEDYIEHQLQDAEIVVDALLGTGQHGPFLGELEWLLAALRREQQRKPELQVVAVDIPTGIDADTGEAISENYVRANITCTFAYPKVGITQGEGKKAAGEIVVLDIGFDEVGVGPASG